MKKDVYSLKVAKDWTETQNVGDFSFAFNQDL